MVEKPRNRHQRPVAGSIMTLSPLNRLGMSTTVRRRSGSPQLPPRGTMCPSTLVAGWKGTPVTGGGPNMEMVDTGDIPMSEWARSFGLCQCAGCFRVICLGDHGDRLDG